MKNCAIIVDDAVQGIRKDINGDVNIFEIKHLYPYDSGVPQQPVEFVNSPSKPSLQRTPTCLLPTQESLAALISNTNEQFDEVFCLISANGISPLYQSVEELSANIKGRARFHHIHTETLSFGQGYLVNKCIELFSEGVPAQRIEEILRETLPGIYALLCVPEISYLYTNGFIDAGQLIAGELHSIQPVYSLENGSLNPLEKTKNGRGVADLFTEFLDEFEQLDAVAFIHPREKPLPFFQEINQLAVENSNAKSFYSFSSNAFLSNLIGPGGFGMVLVE